MRKAEKFAMSRDEAVDLFRSTSTMHLAGSDPDGRPVLKTVHPVVVDGVLAFHSAPVGEKLTLLDNDVVASAEETIAEIPSYFFDSERACPATTYYRAAQARGRLRSATDGTFKAKVLQALMDKYQPEGGHVPLDHDNPLYTKAIDGLLVAFLPLDAIVGKLKVGQNKKPEDLERVLVGLWHRGEPGDPRAIELIRRLNPRVPCPQFLKSTSGAQLDCWVDTRDLSKAVNLLVGEYWNEGLSPGVLETGHRHASGWVGARDCKGELVATARAISDWSKHAWVFDVAVESRWRAKGLGSDLMQLLLDHPAIRNCRKVWLATRGAETFYHRFGFQETERISTRGAHDSQLMVLDAARRTESGRPYRPSFHHRRNDRREL